MSDGKFILCTKEGQILQCDSNGDYKKVMIFDPKKPTKTSINSVQAFTIGGNVESSGKPAKAGFLVGYESGHIRVYMKSDTIGIPYKRVESDRDDLMMLNDYERSTEMHKKNLSSDVMYHKITSMCLSPNEEQLIFGTDMN